MKTIKNAVLAMIALAMTSCAAYTISIETPDGLTITGRALVMNESDDVALTVETPNYSASFGKQGTSADTNAKLAADVIDSLTGPSIPIPLL